MRRRKERKEMVCLEVWVDGEVVDEFGDKYRGGEEGDESILFVGKWIFRH